jgi:hypothetical protein
MKYTRGKPLEPREKRLFSTSSANQSPLKQSVTMVDQLFFRLKHTFFELYNEHFKPRTSESFFRYT